MYMVGLSSEKAMAPHSSTLAWKIPRTEEPGRLQSKCLGAEGTHAGAAITQAVTEDLFT